VPRKRDTPPEALLQRVITGLENDSPVTYRGAVLALLSEGPLLCPEALLKEIQQPATEEWDAGIVRMSDVLRAELLAYLRQTVRNEDTGVVGYPISIGHSVTFSAIAAGRRVTCGAEGAMRDVVVLQMLLLLDRVGLSNVRICGVGDCQRLFVKTYRREFCSARCQQRDYKRKLRQRTREQHEQKARTKRRRITNETRPVRIAVTHTTRTVPAPYTVRRKGTR
jgi:endogenous inhibitor of DNA gyrase (YacG/DUF329 family)